MHILLIHQAFTALDEPGGTRHHELARFLVEKGHRVSVIASRVSYLTGSSSPAAETRQESDGLKIWRAYTYQALHRSFFHRVLSFFSFMASSFWIGLQIRDVDVVWGTSPPIFQGFTAWLLAALKRAPFLFEVRDLWPAFAIQVGVLRSGLLIALSEWLERFLYRRARRVLVNSPGFISHVQARGARRVELVPNGADPEMFDPQTSGEPFRRANGLLGKFVVLYAGAHGMSNDLEVVLEAAAILAAGQKPDAPEITLVLLGAGKEKAALQNKAQQMQLKNVVFLPPVPKVEMAGALAAADVCLAILKPIPLYATVYPNKVFDYMAAGKPVALAIDGVIRQTVETAQAGLFVQPGSPAALAQAVQYLASSPDECQAMGRRGRQYVETHFDRRVMAAQLETIFFELTRKQRT